MLSFLSLTSLLALLPPSLAPFLFRFPSSSVALSLAFLVPFLFPSLVIQCLVVWITLIVMHSCLHRQSCATPPSPFSSPPLPPSPLSPLPPTISCSPIRFPVAPLAAVALLQRGEGGAARARSSLERAELQGSGNAGNGLSGQRRDRIWQCQHLQLTRFQKPQWFLLGQLWRIPPQSVGQWCGAHIGWQVVTENRGHSHQPTPASWTLWSPHCCSEGSAALKGGKQLPTGPLWFLLRGGAAPQVEAGVIPAESREERETGWQGGLSQHQECSQRSGQVGTTLSHFSLAIFIACFHTLSWSPDVLASGALPRPPISFTAMPRHTMGIPYIPPSPCPGLSWVPSFSCQPRN